MNNRKGVQAMVAYPNLCAEIARRGLKRSDVGKALQITRVAFSNKINGRTPFTLKEAVTIKAFLNVDVPLEVLFERA